MPGLNLVESKRAAQTVGYLAVFVVVILLSRRPALLNGRVALTCATLCAALTAYGVSSLQVNLPTLRSVLVVLFALVVGVVVFFITRFPRRRWPVVVALVCAAASVAIVNPLQFGLGDLRGTPLAAQMQAYGDQARKTGSYWVTDGMLSDALLIAEGVPSLSGRQITGPIRSEWAKLDPTGQYEQQWNRGSSYLLFTWSQGDTVKVTNPGLDIIVVSVDPCTLADRGFNVTNIVSSAAALPNPCLTQTGSFTWGGVQDYIYKVS